MGCDIHFYVEVRHAPAFPWVHHDWRKPYQVGTYKDGSTEYDYHRLFKDPLYVGRCYDLFAILADVRNGGGFADVKTGDGFTPISQPRGLPADVTAEVKRQSADYGVDGHSHSWLRLDELLDFDWEGQRTTHQGVVGPKDFELWRTAGKPESWAGSVWGPKHVSNDEMARLIDTGLAGKDDGLLARKFVTTVRWEESYADSVRWFLDGPLPALKALGDPENVRVVFWFDN